MTLIFSIASNLLLITFCGFIFCYVERESLDSIQKSRIIEASWFIVAIIEYNFYLLILLGDLHFLILGRCSKHHHHLVQRRHLPLLWGLIKVGASRAAVFLGCIKSLFTCKVIHKLLIHYWIMPRVYSTSSFNTKLVNGREVLIWFWRHQIRWLALRLIYQLL